MQRAQVVRLLTGSVGAGASLMSRLTHHVPRPTFRRQEAPRHSALFDMVWSGFLLMVALYALYEIALFVHAEVTLGEVLHVIFLGFLTLIRVLVLILLASIVWVPIGVWIGLRPRVAHRVQPIIQFLAAFPANLFFPIVVSAIVVLKLNPEIWLSPLMILGTQWYILFNVIGGTLALPTDYQYVAGNFGVRNFLWWRRLILPAIFPAYVTGAVTASGGSWNASIVAEIAKWGNTTLQATGIGAYIADMTAKGDFPRIALGITVLSLYVLLINRLLWRRLYHLAEERLRLD
jgi:NitT/TauT family transport system permease protein